MKKYEMTDIRSGNLRRIRALRDIPRYNVQAGDLGGWIETENNLSQDGDCWVGDNAWVSGNAWVADDAQVKGSAWVKGSATIYGNAWVGGNARVDDNARVRGNARVKDNAHMGGYAVVSGNVCLQISAVINSTRDYLAVGPIGSRNDYTTFYRTASDIWVRCGCFNGSINDFAKKVRETHGNNPHARAYLAAIELAKIQIPDGTEQNLQRLIAHWKQELNKQIEDGFGVNRLAVTVETIDALEHLLKTKED